MLTAFDEQLRRGVRSEPGTAVERDGPVVRVVDTGGGWSGVVHSRLEAAAADAVIAAQIERFAQSGRSWEWKYYSYDSPADLPDRLLAAGFRPDPAEALLVAEISELDLGAQPPAGVQLHPVLDRADVQTLVAVHDAVFGGDHADIGRVITAGLRQQPATVAAVLAVADGTAVSAGRVEFHRGTDFASLWGGGTLPSWRGRGVFRALVGHRAARARAAGFRYLQVDASADSRPILRRLGFVELAMTTPYRWTPAG